MDIAKMLSHMVDSRLKPATEQEKLRARLHITDYIETVRDFGYSSLEFMSLMSAIEHSDHGPELDILKHFNSAMSLLRGIYPDRVDPYTIIQEYFAALEQEFTRANKVKARVSDRKEMLNIFQMADTLYNIALNGVEGSRGSGRKT